MNTSGIPSLRGFIFQKQIFFFLAVSEFNRYESISFESINDDIETKPTDKSLIYSIMTDNNVLMQVKSGRITIDTLYDVFTNWILCPTTPQNYILFTEKPIPKSFNKDDNFIKNLFNKCEEILIEHPKSNKGKLGLLYQNRFSDFSNRIKSIFPIFQVKTMTSDEVVENMFEAFALENKDVLDNNIIELRCENTIKELNKKLENCILDGKAFVLTKEIYSGIRNYYIKNVSEDKYEMHIPSFFDVSQKQFDDILFKVDDNLVQQLKRISDDNDFLYSNIMAKIEYKRFRDIYESKENDIDYNEGLAKFNFNLEFNNPNNKLLYDLYTNVINRPINMKLLVENQLSRTGCYNYLASSDSKDKYRIEWGLKNE